MQPLHRWNHTASALANAKHSQALRMTVSLLRKKAPRGTGALSSCQRQLVRIENRLRGRLLGRAIDHLRSNRIADGDRNAAGLLGLGDLADEIDVEQAVLKR